MLHERSAAQARIAELEAALANIRDAMYDRDTDDAVLHNIGNILTETGFPWVEDD